MRVLRSEKWRMQLSPDFDLQTMKDLLNNVADDVVLAAKWHKQNDPVD